MVKEFLLSKTFAGIALMVAGYFFGGDITAATLSSNPQMLDTVTTVILSGGAALAGFDNWRRVKKTEDLRTLVDTTSNITDNAQDEIKRLRKEVDSLKNNPPSVAEAAKVMSQHSNSRKAKVKNPLT